MNSLPAWEVHMATELAADTVISGSYRVVRTIGRGGMGEVYEVRHLRTKAALALKILLPDKSLSPQLFQRFKREAEITSNLNHPNIVRVFDFDSMPDGRPFLVMELLNGRELTRLLDPASPLPWSDVAAIVKQIAQGLSAAHEHGVVHRDLKPGNIFMMTMPGGDRELVKLLDFGISKVRGGASHLTGTDTVMGTPNYMSPEQASGRTEDADGRADQFALAAIIYEMLSGHMAFPGETAVSVLYRVVHQHPPALRSWAPTLPVPAEHVVTRALSKHPDQRFPTIEAFARAFDDAIRPSSHEHGPGPAVANRGARIAGEVQMHVVPPLVSTTLRGSTGEMRAASVDSRPARGTWRKIFLIAGGVAAAAAAIAVFRPLTTHHTMPIADRPAPPKTADSSIVKLLRPGVNPAALVPTVPRPIAAQPHGLGSDAPGALSQRPPGAVASEHPADDAVSSGEKQHAPGKGAAPKTETAAPSPPQVLVGTAVARKRPRQARTMPQVNQIDRSGREAAPHTTRNEDL